MGDAQFMEKKVAKWAALLEKEDNKVEHALHRLESVKINLRLLSVTGIGKAVNSLRKHPKWGERVTALVSRWKDVARAETAAAAVQSSQTSANESSEDEQRKVDSPPQKIPNGHNKEHVNSAHENGYGLKAVKHENGLKAVKRKRRLSEHHEHSYVDCKKEVDSDDAMDAFSAQLATADQVQIKGQPRKRRKRITAESIQSSLLDSLTNPMLGQSTQVIAPKPQTHQQQAQFHQEQPSSLDINMFKAPRENRRVYAGRKKNGTSTVQEVPRLYDICMRVLMNNIDAIEETGDCTYEMLLPVLEKANAAQLYRLEEKNPQLQESTDEMWMQHCEREFAKELAENIQEQQSRDEEDAEEEEDGEQGDFFLKDGLTWRQRFQKFSREREKKLRRLSNRIKTKTSELIEPQRKALETAPIAPRNVRKRQIQNGMVVSADRVPSAIELTKARRQIFENGNDADLRQMPSAIRNTTSTLGSRSGGGIFSTTISSAKKKPQQGPLMLKTLKMLKMQRR